MIRFTVGPAGDLDPEGNWHRRIELPDGAFHPDPADPAFQTTTSVLSLPLPATVAHLLHGYWLPEDREQVLGDLIDLPPGSADLETAKRRLGQLLRDRVGSRLRLDHLQRALRERTHCQTGCEVTTYCLAGDTRQTPPIALLYTSPPVSDLQRVYRELGRTMFGEGP